MKRTVLSLVLLLTVTTSAKVVVVGAKVQVEVVAEIVNVILCDGVDPSAAPAVALAQRRTLRRRHLG